MAKQFYAVMGVSTDDFSGLEDLGVNILNKMYDVNAALFPSPLISKPAFTTLVTDFQTSQAAMKGGGDLETATRNNDATALRNAIKLKVIPYVNQLFPNDKENQLKSGCPVSSDPQPHDIPEKRSLKDVVKGTEVNSLRVRLNKITSPLKKQPDKLTYLLFQSDDEAGTVNLKLACVTTNSNKLIAKGLTALQYYFFAVAAVNAAGQSELSSRIKGAYS